MSDDLFTLPEQPLDPLAEARRRFAAAQDAYNAADEPKPAHLSADMNIAGRELFAAERAELQRRLHP